MKFITKEHNFTCRVVLWVVKWFRCTLHPPYGASSPNANRAHLVSVLSTNFSELHLVQREGNNQGKHWGPLIHHPQTWQQQKHLCIPHRQQAQWDDTSPCSGLTRFDSSPSLQSLPELSLYFFFLSRTFPSTVSAGNHPPSCTRRSRKWLGRSSPKHCTRHDVCQMP